jgi:uncharacterized membrane protein
MNWYLLVLSALWLLSASFAAYRSAKKGAAEFIGTLLGTAISFWLMYMAGIFGLF